MTFPKHYTLKKEHDRHFEIHDARDNKSFHVAKRDLHPANQIKIMRLPKFAEGGQAAPMPDPQKARDAWAGAQHGEADRLSDQINQLKNLVGWGGQQPKKYDVGGNVTPVLSPVLQAPQQQPDMAQLPWTTQLGQQIGNVTGTGLRALGAGAMDLGAGIGHMAQGVGQGMGLIDPSSMSGTPVAGTPPPGEAAPPAGVNPSSLATGQQEQRAPAAESMGPKPPDIMGEYQTAEAQQKQSVMDQYGASAQKAQADANLYGNEQTQLAALAKDHQTRLQGLQQRNDQIFDKASKGEIDPEHYWKQKPGYAKALAAVSIIIGGIGQGLSKSTSNAGLDAINRNIDKDIDAQKHNINQQNNLFRMNMEMFHNEQEAHMATKADLLTMTAAKANQIAAQAGTPEAEAKKNWLLGELGKQAAQMHQQLATAGISRTAYTDGVPSAAVPYLHPDQQKRMVRLPNGNMADAGNETNVKEYNEHTAAFNPIMSDLTELKGLNTLGNRMDPAQRDRAHVLMNNLTTQLNDLAKSHRISESDIGFQKGQLSDPTAMATLLSGNAGTDQLMQSLTRKQESIGSQYVPAFANLRQRQNQIKSSIPFKAK